MRTRPAWSRLGLILGAGALTAALWAGADAASGRAPAAATAAGPQAALEKARVDGKYRMLLRQIKVDAKDAADFGAFKDIGSRDQREFAGCNDLPKGYWVYAEPYLFIWRDMTSVQRPKRQWGPEQATGEPDTNMAGDIVTAWASASQDNQEEWLTLEYQDFVTPTAVLVYETYNPGALYRVTAFKPDGEEVELWKGADPTPTDSGMGVSEIPVKAAFKTNRVKIYIDSPNVPGWNEIDAVGIRDKDKAMHWAVAADASSTYAPPYPPDGSPVTTAVDVLTFPDGLVPQAQLREAEQRIQKLEDEVRTLKTAVEELKKGKEQNDK